MDPSKPVVDLRPIVEKANVPLYHRRFSNGHYLSIEGPPIFRSQLSECFRTYEIIRSKIREVTGRECAFDVRLTIIALSERPPNYLCTSPSFNGYQDCIIEVAPFTPLSKRLCMEAAHEMTHKATRIVENVVADGNSFSEGLAMYMELRCLQVLYPEASTERTRDYAKAFMDARTRTSLWHWYNPAPYDPSPFPGMTKQQVLAYWKPIDDSYHASGGMYVFFERSLGSDRFLQMVQELCARTQKAQDESFYEDVSHLAGFDVRQASEQQVRQVLNPVLEAK